MSAAAVKEYFTCDAPWLRGPESQIEPQFARIIVVAFGDRIDAMKGHSRKASPNYNIAVMKRVPADSIAAPLTSPEQGCWHPE
jgi:hypothetical protein